jgi:hypothetical protein
MPHCRWLLLHKALMADDRALASAGNSMPAKMAMMAMTTSSSMSVKAVDRGAEFRRGVIGRLIGTLLQKTDGGQWIPQPSAGMIHSPATITR